MVEAMDRWELDDLAQFGRMCQRRSKNRPQGGAKVYQFGTVRSLSPKSTGGPRARRGLPIMGAWSKNSCSFLIVVFEQGAGPFPASNGHVTWIAVSAVSCFQFPFQCAFVAADSLADSLGICRKQVNHNLRKPGLEPSRAVEATHSCSFLIVVLEQPTEPFPASNGPIGSVSIRGQGS